MGLHPAGPPSSTTGDCLQAQQERPASTPTLDTQTSRAPLPAPLQP